MSEAVSDAAVAGEKSSLLQAVKPASASRWLSLAALGFLLVLLVAALLYPDTRAALVESTFATLDWVELNPWLGSLVMVVLYVPFVALILPPPSLLNVACGFCFPFPAAVLVAWTGCTCAAVAVYFICRWQIKELVRHYVLSRFSLLTQMDTLVQMQGAQVVMLLRLPFAPFSIMSYALCCSSCSLSNIVQGNLGILPALCVYAYIGSEFSSVRQLLTSGEDALSDEQRSLLLVFYGCTLLLMCLLLLMLGWYAKSKVKQAEAQLQRQKEEA